MEVVEIVGFRRSQLNINTVQQIDCLDKCVKVDLHIVVNFNAEVGIQRLIHQAHGIRRAVGADVAVVIDAGKLDLAAAVLLSVGIRIVGILNQRIPEQ